VRGKVDEPEAVKLERETARLELEKADGAEREQLEALLLKDPVLAQPAAEGLGQSMVPFGPFLVLALIEYQLFGNDVIFPFLFDVTAP
jgi:leader peptidase (prepilin peptidase)/N-methyltransferase